MGDVSHIHRKKSKKTVVFFSKTYEKKYDRTPSAISPHLFPDVEIKFQGFSFRILAEAAELNYTSV